MRFITTHVARFLFALPFMAFGIGHLTMVSTVSGMVPESVPGNGSIYVYLTGIFEIIASGAIIFKRYDYYASIGLAVLLLLYAFLVHLPAVYSGVPSFGFMNFLKDIALSGAALLYAGTTKK